MNVLLCLVAKAIIIIKNISMNLFKEKRVECMLLTQHPPPLLCVTLAPWIIPRNNRSDTGVLFKSIIGRFLTYHGQRQTL